MIQILTKLTDKNSLYQVAFSLHLMGLLGLVAIGASFVYGFYKPLECGHDELVVQRISLQDFLDTKKNIVNENLEARQILNDRRKYLDDLLQRIPSKPSEDTFLAQLSKIARESGVAIKNFSPGKPSMMQRHARLDIDISAHASYEGICQFLDGIARLPRLCQITSFEVDSSLSPTNQYQFKAKLRIFYAPIGSTASIIPAPEGDSHARS